MKFAKLFWRAYNAHVLIISFLVGLFVMVLIGVQQNLDRTELSLRNSLGVVAFLQSKVTDTEANALIQSLKTQDPDLLSVEYTSKEKAYEEAMKDPNLSKSLLLLKSNPLPASLTLHYSDRVWWERTQPIEKIQSSQSIQEIRWDPQAYAIYRSVHRWRLWCLRFSAFVSVTLLVWAFIGVYRLVSLPSRSSEIAVTLAIGWFGGMLAWGLWGIGLHSIQAEFSSLSPVWVWLLPMAIGMVAALGCYGLEVRRAD